MKKGGQYNKNCFNYFCPSIHNNSKPFFLPASTGTPVTCGRAPPIFYIRVLSHFHSPHRQEIPNFIGLRAKFHPLSCGRPVRLGQEVFY